jgi:cysteinyl-tRNA synthetase
MAKSAGNFQRITELVDEGTDPLAFRYLCLTARYARKLNLSTESLAGAAAGLASLRDGLAALGPAPSSGPWVAPQALHAGRAPDRPTGMAEGAAGHGAADGFAMTDRAGAPGAPLSEAGRKLHDRFVSAIDDDLDTPRAVRVVREMLRAPIAADERRWLILDADLVLGLDLDRAMRPRVAPPEYPLPPKAYQLLKERAFARENRDYPRADRLREELRALGVDVVDAADGTSEARLVE